jgi:hypothetical protein
MGTILGPAPSGAQRNLVRCACRYRPGRFPERLLQFAGFPKLAANQHLKRDHRSASNESARRGSALGAHVIYTRQVLDLSKLTSRQRRWEHPDGLCALGSWGAEPFIEPVRGAHVVSKYRYDVWQSGEFVDLLDVLDIDGLVIFHDVGWIRPLAHSQHLLCKYFLTRTVDGTSQRWCWSQVCSRDQRCGGFS